MNGKPGTRAELAALAAAETFCREQGLPFADHLQTLHEKLSAPFRPRDTGPDIAAVERGLVAASDGAIVPIEGANPGWWASLSRRSEGRDMSPGAVASVGKWLARQPWARGMTVDRVVAGWPSYLTRARADERRDGDRQTGGRSDYDPGDVA